MEYRFSEALPILRRTPHVLRAQLLDLPEAWTDATEGHGTWSPFDIVGHLIHGERTDWVPRIEHMLQHGDAVPFPAFDREAMFAASKGLSLRELLDTFAGLRAESLARLQAFRLTDADLSRRGRHPEFGVVTMGQHLATWVAHDLGHVSQVVRVMARQYTDAVGPWRGYLSILRPDSTKPQASKAAKRSTYGSSSTPGKRVVKPPADFVKALKAAGTVWDRWQTLSYSHQREHVEAIEGAKQAETRSRRIQKAVQQIRAMPARKR